MKYVLNLDKPLEEEDFEKSKDNVASVTLIPRDALQLGSVNNFV